MPRHAWLAGVVAVATAAPAYAQPTEARHAPGAHAALDVRVDPSELPPEPGDEDTFGRDIGLYDPSGQSMRPLHEALRRASDGTGQARILVYGASHVAADFFSNVIRERLQARFGDAGHGFVLPARAWRGYRHFGVSVESSPRGWEGLRVRASTRETEPLGVAGMAVEGASGAAWGRVDTGDHTASRFVLFYLKQPGGGGFDVLLDGRRVARLDTDAAELGSGVHVVTAEDARHVLEVRLRGTGPVRLFGVSVERERPGVIVDNMGLNGARASSHLLWSEDMHREHLRRLDPSLVVLAYGTNESGDDDHPIEAYEAILRRVVARVRATVPSAACLLVGPSDRPMQGDAGALVDRPRTHQVIEVQRRVSRDFGCGFFDLLEFGGGPLSMVRWAASEPAYAQRDHIHFTGRGYLRLGEVLHDAIMRRFDTAPRFEPPAAVAAGYDP